jgi:DNA repair protein RecO (recombination protein O)
LEWRDEGLVIGVKRHGETSAIIEALTKAHGRHLGLVRGGRSARLQSLLQPGNSLGLVWRARLDEHLGSYAIEPLNLRAGRLIASGLALAGVSYLGTLLRLLPERDPHESLHEALEIIADHLDLVEVAPALIARFELQVLAECGFQLDLERCAASGARDDLIYVSPKTGRAISASAGAPWRDRLLALPAFLRADDPSTAPTAGELADAFRLTGFFLERNLFGARGLPMPDARRAFLAAATK